MAGRHDAIDRLLLRRQDLSRSDQCTTGSLGRFPLFCVWLKNENADAGPLLSGSRALLGRCSAGERRDGGRWKEEEEEERGVRNVRTKSLGDHSPGSPSV